MRDMDLKLYEGDFVPAGTDFAVVSGREELLQRALIRLAVKKGSFALLPEFGSEVYKLRTQGGTDLAARARTYANAALLPMGLEVESVLAGGEGDALTLEFFIGGGGNLSLTV